MQAVCKEFQFDRTLSDFDRILYCNFAGLRICSDRMSLLKLKKVGKWPVASNNIHWQEDDEENLVLHEQGDDNKTSAGG